MKRTKKQLENLLYLQLETIELIQEQNRLLREQNVLMRAENLGLRKMLYPSKRYPKIT